MKRNRKSEDACVGGDKATGQPDLHITTALLDAQVTSLAQTVKPLQQPPGSQAFHGPRPVCHTTVTGLAIAFKSSRPQIFAHQDFNKPS